MTLHAIDDPYFDKDSFEPHPIKAPSIPRLTFMEPPKMKTYKLTIQEITPAEGENKYTTERLLVSADVNSIKQIKALVEALQDD